MTDKVLNEYYAKHKDMYMSLASNCTSVPEVLLKIDIYGKHWGQWDWVLLFASILNSLTEGVHESSANSTTLLYRDIIDAIDCTSDLDKIMTNKQIMLSIIYTINSPGLRFSSGYLRIELCALIAHVFGKFPKLWNVSWMYAKFYDHASKKWQKYHRLKSAVYASPHKQDQVYYNSKLYYNDFMKLYLPIKRNESEEDKEEES